MDRRSGGPSTSKSDLIRDDDVPAMRLDELKVDFDGLTPYFESDIGAQTSPMQRPISYGSRASLLHNDDVNEVSPIEQEENYISKERDNTPGNPLSYWPPETSSFVPYSRWPRFKNRAIYYWLPEIASLFMSYACFAAIISVLASYNNLNVEDWSSPSQITLNAVVSFITVLGTAFLAGPISSAIGQAKWIWFRASHRRLAHFQAFDDASRGAMGSITFLAKSRGSFMAIFGAVLTILLLGVNPFVQQVIALAHRIVYDGTAIIPIAVTYYATVQTSLLSVAMEAAICWGAMSSLNNPSFSVTPVCSTGNCSWTSYNTLAVCNTCSNITHLLQTLPSSNKSDQAMNGYMLPNGFSLLQSDGSGQAVMNITGNFPTLAFGMNGSRIDSIGFIGQVEADQTIQAWECMLQFCIKTYNATADDGVFTETEVTAWANQSNYDIQNAYETCSDLSNSDAQAECENGWTFTPSQQPEDEVQQYSVDPKTLWNLANFLQMTFTGSWTLAPPGGNNVPTIQGDPMFMQRFQSVTATSAIGLSEIFDNVAGSMSISVRTPVDSDHNDIGSGAGVNNRQGISSSSVTIYHVTWIWLAFPLVLLVLTSGLLVATIIRSKDDGLQPWKNSSIALLAYGLDNTSRGVIAERGRDGLQAAEEAAMLLKVKLEMEKHDGAWALTEA